MDRRVVITGLGAVTPCGNSPEELWNSLMAGRHGFELAPWFPDQEPDNLSVVSRVKNFDASEYFDKKELRRSYTDKYAFHKPKSCPVIETRK